MVFCWMRRREKKEKKKGEIDVNWRDIGWDVSAYHGRRSSPPLFGASNHETMGGLILTVLGSLHATAL
jgi:hypothetical protein